MADRAPEYNALKKAFGAGSKKAPEALWGNIAGKMDAGSRDVLAEKIAESFNLHHQKAAPGFVWEGVNRQLNIDRTWNGLKRVLDGYSVRRRVVRYAAAAIVLIMLSLASAEYFGVFRTAGTGAENTGFAGRELQHKEQDEQVQPLDATPEKSSQTPAIQARAIATTTSVPVAMADDNITPAIFAAEPLLAKLPALNVREKRVSTITIAQLPVIATTTEENKKVHKTRGRFSIGAIYGVNQTTLLNNETRLSGDERSLISSSAAYAGFYGVTGRYALTKNGTLHGTIFIGDRVKQTYHTYIEGIYTEKQIVLDYRKVSLSYQRNLLHIPNTSISTYVRAGLYQAWLANSSISLNQVQKAAAEYGTHDNGITLQLGQQAGRGNWKIGYGLNFEKGRENIFSGKSNVPAHFNVTTTMRMGAFTEIFYTF